jgi:hypothetical protein
MQIGNMKRKTSAWVSLAPPFPWQEFSMLSIGIFWGLW